VEVFWNIIDFITAVLFIVLFVGISWGAILRYKDKQAEWQDRKEYNAMKKNIEKGRKNDTARNRRL
tara:strand:+ start:224 stop:421 length:198 start_codon:yes stop_codon:yes gene_type:complete